MAVPGSPYRIDFRPVVKNQLQELTQRAAGAGIREEYLRVLDEAIEQLSTAPQAWGDPRHNLLHEGGML